MRLPYLPSLEPDETLYSWSCYVHKVSANVSAEKTSQALYGATHTVRQHELPTRVALLAQEIGVQLPVADLLRQHTVLRCYLPFIHPEKRDEAFRAAAAGEPFWQRSLLGASRSRAISHPLRLCAACVSADQEQCGRALWHVQHQLPGAWHCSRHEEPLLLAKSRPKQWLAPEAALSEARPIAAPTGASMIAAGVGAAAGRQLQINATGLRNGAIARLQELGVLHSRHSVRHDRLTAWFKSTDMSRLCANSDSGLQALADGSWIASQLWRQKRNHPARWVVLWSALQWRDSKDASRQFADASAQRVVDASGQFVFEELCVSRVTPSVVEAVLEQATSYREAIEAIGCSKVDLVRWLELDPALRLRWRERRRQVRLNSAAMPCNGTPAHEDAPKRIRSERAPGAAPSKYSTIASQIRRKPSARQASLI